MNRLLVRALRKIWQFPKNKVIELPRYGINFYVADTRDSVQARIYYFKSYEPNIEKLIVDSLSEGSCFFDVGSNVGYFSIIAAKRVGETGRVHAFEPLPKNYRVLEVNSQINGLDNVVINKAVVSDKEGEVIFYPPNDPDEWGTGSVIGGNKAEAFKIPSITLENYVRSKNIKRVDLVKIDTEGSEFHVIAGFKCVLEETGFPKIICEVNENWLKLANTQPQDLIASLRHFGYRIYKITAKGLKPFCDDFQAIFNILAVHD